MSRHIRVFVTLLCCVLLLGSASTAAKVKVRWAGWGTQAQADQMKATVDEFNASHPDIELSFELSAGNDKEHHDKMLTQYLGGVGPDLINLGEQYLISFAEAGVIEPLGRHIPSSWIQDVYPKSLLDLVTYKGEIYTLLGGHNALMVYYHKDLYDQYGLVYPKPDWTFTEFLRNAQRMTKDTNGDGIPEQWGYTWDAWWGPMFAAVWSNGGQIFKSDYSGMNIQSKESADALQFIQDLMYKYDVSPSLDLYGKQGGAEALYMQGRSGMYMSGTWPLDTYLSKGVPVGVVRVPRGDNAQYGTTYFPAATIVVNRSSKNLQATIEVWKWLMGPERAARESKNALEMPIYKSVLFSSYLGEKVLPQGSKVNKSMMQDIVNAASYGNPLPNFNKWMQVNGEAIWPNMVNVVLNKMSGAQAVQAIQEAGDRLMKAK